MSEMGIGLQLYTLREETKRDFKGTLHRVAEIGYDGVEFAGFGDFTASELATLLQEIGLESVGSHVGVDDLRNNLDGVIEFQCTIGSRYVMCPWMPKELYDTPEHLHETADFLNHVGRRLSEHGLVFGYHNHWFEFTDLIAGELLYDALFSQTNPNYVKAELDVCWTQRGGQDPIEYIKKYAGRIPLIHLKDMRINQEEQVLTVALGEGIMGLEHILQESGKAGVDWLIVEQDNVQYDAFESISNSLGWLKTHY